MIIVPGGVLMGAEASGSARPKLASTDELVAALAALPDPLFVLKAVRDPDGTATELVCVYLNEAAALLYGVPIQVILGRGQRGSEEGLWDTYLQVIESGSTTSCVIPWQEKEKADDALRVTVTKFGDGLLVLAHDVSGQVVAEKAVAADRAMLRATVDSLMDPHVRFEAVRDQTGKIVDFLYADANPAACAYANADLVGKRLLDVFPAHAPTGLLQMYAHVVDRGEPLVLDDFAYPLDLMGGQERYYDVRAVRVGDGLSYTNRDVTDRHLAAETAQRMAAIVEHSDDAIIAFTLDGIVTNWNPGAERMYGYSSQEAIGTSIFGRTPKDQVDEISSIVAKVRAGQGGEHIETDRVRKDGTVIPVSFTISPIRDEDGTIVGISTIARDMTQQRKAIEIAQRMAAIVESSHDAIVSESLDDIITSWNPAAERMFGYSSEEIIGKPGTLLGPEDRTDEITAILAKVGAGVPVEPLETVRVRKDGTVFPVSLTVSPIRDAGGEVIGAAGTFRDVTELKEAAQYARSLIEAGLDPMVTISPDGKITDVNEATVKATGVPRDKLLGTDFSVYFTEPEKAEEVYQRVLDQGPVTDYPLTLRHRNEHEMPAEVLFNASVYRDTIGRVRGVLAVARDVTAQKQAQREIADQQAREQERLEELEQFQKLTVGRELKMIELKKEIEYLKKHGPSNGSDPGHQH
jgi:PAS domain S-box-containing protein